MPAEAQIFRCESSSGVVYSEAPCQVGKQRTLDLPLPQHRNARERAIEEHPVIKSATEIVRQRRQEAAERERRKQEWLEKNPHSRKSIREGIETSSPAIGMSAGEVLIAVGPPSDHREHIYATGKIEWWHYNERSPTLSLRFHNGLLESIHK